MFPTHTADANTPVGHDTRAPGGRVLGRSRVAEEKANANAYDDGGHESAGVAQGENKGNAYGDSGYESNR